jgi:O-acetyl-ADP-ribose deacetylase (regulator of RNase III)
MERLIINANIVDVKADALIYSTNVQLVLTGGVGAALMQKCGWGIQNDLLSCSPGSGRRMAEVGDVFETRSAEYPWKIVFHTVVTNELYHTQPDTVLRVLRRCVRRCAELEDIKSVVTSPLGAAYGDLDLEPFVRIADQVCDLFDQSTIQTFSIVCRDVEEFDKLKNATKNINSNWKEAG